MAAQEAEGQQQIQLGVHDEDDGTGSRSRERGLRRSFEGCSKLLRSLGRI